MAKTQSPLLGYNTNVRHKGKVFHIQTEDSGVNKPHVITHLFADGGRIIKSVKTSYADRLDTPDLQAQVKKLMQDQHKAMFVALRDGVYDAAADIPGSVAPEAAPAPEAPPAPQPEAVESVEAAEAPDAASAASAPMAPESLATLRDPAPAPSPRTIPVPIPVISPDASLTQTLTDDSIELDESSFVEDVPAPPPVPLPPSSSKLGVPLPPLRTQPRRHGDWSLAPSVTPSEPAQPSPSGPPPLRPTGSRRPASTSTGPRPSPSSARVAPLFGERLVSERSLDEVILAYLAEELEAAPRR